MPDYREPGGGGQQLGAGHGSRCNANNRAREFDPHVSKAHNKVQSGNTEHKNKVTEGTRVKAAV